MYHFAIACDFAGTFLDQDLVLVGFGIIAHHGCAVRGQGGGGPRHGHLRLRALHIGRSRKIHRACAHRDGYVGLLLIVSRIFFNHNQRILLYRVIGAVVEDDLGHAFRTRLHHIAFFQGHVVIGGYPGVAARLLDPHRAVQRGDVSLLGAACASLSGSARTGHHFQQLAAEVGDRLHSSLRELWERKIHPDKQHDRDQQDSQGHAAIGDRLPRYMDSRFATRRHKWHQKLAKPKEYEIFARVSQA